MTWRNTRQIKGITCEWNKRTYSRSECKSPGWRYRKWYYESEAENTGNDATKSEVGSTGTV